MPLLTSSRAGAALAGLCLSTLAGGQTSAVEAATSPYLKGYKDFLSDVVPPEPGVYVRNDLFYYSGDIVHTTVGSRVAVGLRECSSGISACRPW